MINFYSYYVTFKNFVSYMIFGQKPNLKELEFIVIKKIDDYV